MIKITSREAKVVYIRYELEARRLVEFETTYNESISMEITIIYPQIITIFSKLIAKYYITVIASDFNIYKNLKECKKLTLFFYKQCFFSTQPQCCLTFYIYYICAHV